jgi:hypothetical protein
MPGLLPCDNRSYTTGTAGTGRFGTNGIKKLCVNFCLLQASAKLADQNLSLAI